MLIQSLLGLGLLCMLPLLFLFWQGQRTRARVPRLPEADGPRQGSFPGQGEPLRFLIVGESPAVGVGLARIEEAVSVRTAEFLAQQCGRPVQWTLLGQSGARLTELQARYADELQAAEYDLALVVCGVNDVTANRHGRAFGRDLRALLQPLRARQQLSPVVLAGIPPLGSFPALPRPLSTYLGWRAKRLDTVAAKLASELPAMTHVPCGSVQPQEFADDGYHPNASASYRWAAQLAATCQRLINPA